MGKVKVKTNQIIVPFSGGFQHRLEVRTYDHDGDESIYKSVMSAFNKTWEQLNPVFNILAPNQSIPVSGYN